AAHEKVLYERTMTSIAKKEFTSQMVSPPIIITLNNKEEEVLKKYRNNFTDLGFEIAFFGGKEYAISAVPGNLFGVNDRDLFIEMLDNLTDDLGLKSSDVITEKIASLSCKAAVKGNHTMTFREMDELIGQLMTLENPYACPHGRPTIISMSRYELEKKFKRIV
ncbi:MAG: DNA mismatch repair protein MutL, partial [Lachnospiraceae bacterium]